jgi:citrate synthase
MTITPVPKGLEGIVAAATRISHVDGQAGELIIGGYHLDEIAGRATFEEIAFVLWQLALGHDAALPNRDEYAALTHDLSDLRPISDAALQVIRAARASPPMDALRMALAMMSLDDPAVKDESVAANYRRARMLTARTPTIIAAHDRVRRAWSRSRRSRSWIGRRISCTCSRVRRQPWRRPRRWIPIGRP